MFLERISIKGLLSFGPEGIDLPMRPLNVLIGPNGSGKTNFIEALALLKSAPEDFSRPIRESGGVREWLMRAVLKAVQTGNYWIWGRASKALRELVFADISVGNALPSSSSEGDRR